MNSSDNHFDGRFHGNGCSHAVRVPPARSNGPDSLPETRQKPKTRHQIDTLTGQSGEGDDTGWCNRLLPVQSRRMAAMRYEFGGRPAERIAAYHRAAERLRDRLPASPIERSRHAPLVAPSGSPDFARRLALFSLYGNFTMAYSTLQPAFPKSSRQERVVPTRSAWGFSLHPQEAGRVLA